MKTLLFSFLLFFPVFLHADESCKFDPDLHKRPEEKADNMGRFLIQGIYLGMGFEELKLAKPGVVVQPTVESGVIHEYYGEYVTENEQFLFMLTSEGRLYKLIYKKYFIAAVSEQDLLVKLRQRYGQPRRTLSKTTKNKTFEVCWGQCEMILDGSFCYDQETDHWYTYFTASLDITRKQFNLVLHDSTLYERNEIGFVERKTIKKMIPSTTSLEKLQL
ncbi:MAG: hypothetical protein HQM14_08565 [SAR324 cluster bacterium]|nr:hypothetical protein [SAR324 cluster bacterium]